MQHLLWLPNRASYPICLLTTQISSEPLLQAYVNPYGMNAEDFVVLSLHQSETSKKTPAAEMKAYIEEELVPVFNNLKVEYLVVNNADYFKVLTKAAKVEANLGYVMDCVFGPWKVVYVPDQRSIFYDPEKVRAKIAQGMNALKHHRGGQYVDPGNSVIKFAEYPRTVQEISDWLDKLIEMDAPLSIDIETFSLKHVASGIGTITFCWSKHEGIAFPVDYEPIPGATEVPFGRQVRNEPVRKLLISFFRRMTQKKLFHNIAFDAYILIYQLFMSDLLDTKGLLSGLSLMLSNWDDTKLITYLATNSCAGNRLSLKVNAQEFAGNYAVEEIHDITRVPLNDLLQYNLVDGLSTWFVHEKHYPTMVADQQLDVYENLFKPCMWDIIQMQLTGMPVNMKRAKEVNVQLQAEEQAARDKIMNSDIVQHFTADYLNVKYAEKMNSKWVKKRITPAEANQEFNPNSDLQVRALLFEWLQLPVINLTDNKLPSTDGETIEALLNRVTDPKIKELLEAFQMFTIIGTLTTTFMPAILGAAQGPDGWHYLFGNFNLGGTISGRLSSSGPNLQNLPSTGKGHKIKIIYAKMIKSCFAAPPGWLFVGIDFSSLEDRISALTTKDPNKLKVYTDGYDGHSLRAYAYWPDKMPDIDPSSVDSINSIAKKYKPLRDRSKNPTFTLTYQGTEHALVKKYGFTVEEAREIVRRYNGLYQVSINWVNSKLDEAAKTGFITAAFGLRLRTPLLKQVIRKTSKTPYEAEAEARTAGNALGQSWCLLNSRAHMAFMQKVRTSQYRFDIRPSAQIHDAGYYLVRDNIETLQYTDQHLVPETFWQDHPEIAHPDVGLGGELSIFYPDWSGEIGIPHGSTEAQIFAEIDKAMAPKG
jgi:DNA polymerase-1